MNSTSVHIPRQTTDIVAITGTCTGDTAGSVGIMNASLPNVGIETSHQPADLALADHRAGSIALLDRAERVNIPRQTADVSPRPGHIACCIGRFSQAGQFPS